MTFIRLMRKENRPLSEGSKQRMYEVILEEHRKFIDRKFSKKETELTEPALAGTPETAPDDSEEAGRTLE